MVTVLAQMMDRGDMGGGDGSGHWWWWVVGLGVLAVLVALVVIATMRSTQGAAATGAQPTPRSAEDVLAARFARGEIDEAEYRRRRDALRE
jgi:putative membrane protein